MSQIGSYRGFFWWFGIMLTISAMAAVVRLLIVLDVLVVMFL